MTMQPILEIELFDVWGLEFMGPYPSSYSNLFILAIIDYVSKWEEVVALLNRSQFIGHQVARALKRYGVNHKIATTYHPQSNGQAEVSNQEIKQILENVVNPSRQHWSQRLEKPLWAYRTAYNTSLGMSPYHLVYGKACHLPVELEYKVMWVLKQLNFDLYAVGKQQMLEINELEELHYNAYENSRIYEDKSKKWHDQHILPREFHAG
ncbi:uncharacterized protein LOC120195341 [Hibiscus syriacus]|uniref:uncharacterized protein LOC120195341 n=1 Tax=Hibiscus syriacus TaxID=106335 RepID=UPI0019249DB9|nr:uncharacterized protein LOC120195341 [Hibiscus syriacus]